MSNKFKEKFKIDTLELLDFKYWVVSVRPKQITVGSLILSLKRDCHNVGDLYKKETEELAIVFSEIENLLGIAFSFDKINYLALMMIDEQVHFHIVPRYEKRVKLFDKSYQDKSWPGAVNVEGVIEEKDIALKVLNYLKSEKARNKVIGYTTGVFDLFHIGHLNILKHAKENCDYLIVGVTTDELVSYKNTQSVIPFKERAKIVEGIKFVDKVVSQSSMDKMAAWEELRFHKMFVGSDWQGTEKWDNFEKQFAKVGVQIQYFPYTQGTSSTKLKKVLTSLIQK